LIILCDEVSALPSFQYREMQNGLRPRAGASSAPAGRIRQVFEIGVDGRRRGHVADRQYPVRQGSRQLLRIGAGGGVSPGLPQNYSKFD
jgi:hypothetical protein